MTHDRSVFTHKNSSPHSYPTCTALLPLATPSGSAAHRLILRMHGSLHHHTQFFESPAGHCKFFSPSSITGLFQDLFSATSPCWVLASKISMRFVVELMAARLSARMLPAATLLSGGVWSHAKLQKDWLEEHYDAKVAKAVQRTYTGHSNMTVVFQWSKIRPLHISEQAHSCKYINIHFHELMETVSLKYCPF